MRRLSTYPVLLEAILGAEEAVLDAELQAGWALQRSSFILAIGAHALLLGGGFGHGVGVGGRVFGGIRKWRTECESLRR